ncbi:L,D-transpeptidase family protein [Sulfurovum sp. CS9]|uniref:L,D-transpeptidase family protein n=1 Tax=Sulfurovum sp. CS9 TaxID=3391146 RepID=UPI0039ED5DB5
MKKIIAILFTIGLSSSTLFAYDTYKEVLIDLSNQRAYAIEDGFVVFEGRISSGKSGRETPNGEFTIIQKKRHHKSNLWPKPNGGAKMPYMMRLTNSGIAMHLGYVPNKPASHGCIRLKNGFAQKMYRWASVGTYVYIEGEARDYMAGRGRDNYYDDYGIIDIYDDY